MIHNQPLKKPTVPYHRNDRRMHKCQTHLDKCLNKDTEREILSKQPSLALFPSPNPPSITVTTPRSSTKLYKRNSLKHTKHHRLTTSNHSRKKKGLKRTRPLFSIRCVRRRLSYLSDSERKGKWESKPKAWKRSANVV